MENFSIFYAFCVLKSYLILHLFFNRLRQTLILHHSTSSAVTEQGKAALFPMAEPPGAASYRQAGARTPEEQPQTYPPQSTTSPTVASSQDWKSQYGKDRTAAEHFVLFQLHSVC